jgi:hypothetical protein
VLAYESVKFASAIPLATSLPAATFLATPVDPRIDPLVSHIVADMSCAVVHRPVSKLVALPAIVKPQWPRPTVERVEPVGLHIPRDLSLHRTRLLDAREQPVYGDGTTVEMLRDAIQAAALVRAWDTVEEIVRNYNCPRLCFKCGERAEGEISASEMPVCDPCAVPKQWEMQIYGMGIAAPRVKREPPPLT